MKTTTLFVVFLEIGLYRLAAAVQPHSLPIVVSPAHHYNCDSITHPSFNPLPSLPDTLVPSWTLRAVPTTVYRRSSHEDLQRPPWEPVEILGPDIEDRHTLSQLARISANAYALPGQKNWYDVDSAWNNVSLHFFCPSSLCLITRLIKEFSFWLGRFYHRLSWACILVSRQ
jgi:lipase ATG15